ncbi:glutathione S-transferase family protein [Stappia sp. MMSF_3263]|uniref:glutathione S-transferase family protein n=1 Tax=Stappia sp. MMSF_3263 TaxID=3046693 RepID=UPI00273D4E63|nr:glutathione S-transferase family protein [Stappia sp. MMSF_3263]
MKLVIGNKTYSSWSLRAWLAARLAGHPFEEVLVPLDTPEFASQIREITPAARVPVLIDEDITVWDSLAIIEYLAERFPRSGLWPAERAARARARAICAEFHSGFSDLRGNYPMNLRRAPAPHPAQPDASRDIARVVEIWRDCRAAHAGEGDFLFGAFSAADCFYAPVVSRFLTYLLPMGEVERAYAQAVMTHPLMLEWRAAAAAESWVLSAEEVD